MKKKVLLVTLLVVAIVASCFAFTACNTLRVVAYVPQLIKIARDTDGAHEHVPVGERVPEAA